MNRPISNTQSGAIALYSTPQLMDKLGLKYLKLLSQDNELRAYALFRHDWNILEAYHQNNFPIKEYNKTDEIPVVQI